MEDLLKNELIKHASSLIKTAQNLPPSYIEAMGEALERFAKNGLPSKKDEDWKYTNITKNLSPKLFQAKEELAKPSPKGILDERGFLIFNNGIFNKFLSVLPEGMEIDKPLAPTEFFDSFDQLNFASATTPVAFKINSNVCIDFPITIMHIVDEAGVNKIVSPRLQIKTKNHSKACFVEIFTTTQPKLYQYTTNASTHFELGANSQIEHIKIQNEALSSVHIGATTAKVSKDARFYSNTLDFGNLTARHNIKVSLSESGAETEVHGLYALSKNHHCDIFTIIDHEKSHTFSDQLYKGILADEAHGVFTGKINVAKDAQQISSAQLNKNLMLSKKAHIDTRPQLLVNADDVKCSHGATIGQLSSDEEFYLRTRGIPKEKAQKLLCHGFAGEIIFKIRDAAVRKWCEVLFSNSFELPQAGRDL